MVFNCLLFQVQKVQNLTLNIEELFSEWVQYMHALLLLSLGLWLLCLIKNNFRNYFLYLLVIKKID